MAKNRIAASFVYTLDDHKPIRNGFVEYDDEGMVIAVGECEDHTVIIIFNKTVSYRLE